MNANWPSRRCLLQPGGAIGGPCYLSADPDGESIRLDGVCKTVSYLTDERPQARKDGFDPALCKMRTSREGTPQPEPVGTFPTDLSPYGVQDLAGCMRDWCGDLEYDGDPDRHPVRGGSWFSPERLCRAAYRDGNAAWLVIANVGFRLARDAESG